MHIPSGANDMIPCRTLVLAALIPLPFVAAEAQDLGAAVETLRLACTSDYLRL